MKIATTAAIALAIPAIISGLLVLNIGKLSSINKQLTLTKGNNIKSIHLANELRQSSDDLTRMVRTYVVTGNTAYRNYFYKILAIRDGTAPRLADYGSIYWDLIIPNEREPREEGLPQISLMEQMTQAGFSQEEFNLLAVARSRSDALVKLESDAMDLVIRAASLSPDDERKRIWLEKARDLVHGLEYHHAKADIMTPIDSFFKEVRARTNREISSLEYQQKELIFHTWVELIAIILGLIAALFLMHRQILRPIQDLVKGTSQISVGNYRVTIDTESNNEIGQLIHEFNKMTHAIWLDIVQKEKTRQFAETKASITIGMYSQGYLETESNGTIVFVNDVYTRTSGYQGWELIGKNISKLDANQSTDEITAYFSQLAQKGHAQMRTQHVKADGTIWPVNVTSRLFPDGSGMSFSFIEDLSEILEREKNAELAAQVLNTMNQAVIVCDANFCICSMNPSAEKITGYRLESIKGKNAKLLYSEKFIEKQNLPDGMWTLLMRKGQWKGEAWQVRSNRKVFPTWSTISVVLDNNNDIDRYVCVFSDISDLKKTEAMIWKQANFDVLTGLLSRAGFEMRFEQELNHHHRAHKSFAIVYLDLDGFKDVNDSLGHGSGDKVLIEVAKRIKQCIRKPDLAARSGGDEFTLLLTNIDSPEQIGPLTSRIIALINNVIIIPPNEVRVGASIGIALYPDDGDTLEELSKHADLAMYHAKNLGKNQVQFFQRNMTIRANNRLKMINELHHAVKDMSFEVFYQPKIRFSDQHFIGVEALIRWRVDNETLIGADEFIPYAEETNLIIPIGAWTIREACRQVSKWNQYHKIQLCAAVNLSARQFRTPNLANEILNILNEQNFPPHLLEIEITESTLIDDFEKAINTLNQLNEIGVKVAIDDFGKGYSSLWQLQRFPINTLKIDQCFVNDLINDIKAESIIRTIINLGKNLNLSVVGEGVEVDEQVRKLTEFGCDIGQGYYFSPPVSAAVIDEKLSKRGILAFSKN
ncbi:PAS domain S-box-containing protein/diguanylate cyclase (GGDEF)-like protein [Nitrosomonas sp. Nm84]|uniref:EAL domain-containing protein n=1 Tax=Nitrosomonas sp. Nm84 TaxID=200124 RepID=UPI000D752B23|nr:EAL domain-containing protein [Nitrosomonas sp. Nm84]PXW91134.1 PAS domain S-box-containing protein/diguanylate cyclase (GGDEF)-like protein [Nitrosomonas sp. Nm84]